MLLTPSYMLLTPSYMLLTQGKYNFICVYSVFCIGIWTLHATLYIGIAPMQYLHSSRKYIIIVNLPQKLRQ